MPWAGTDWDALTLVLVGVQRQCWACGGGDRALPRSGREEERMAMVVDPVCGMRIESEEAAGTMEYEGKTYYFCSQTCHDAFVADPSAYAV